MPVLKGGPLFPSKATKVRGEYLSKKYFYQRSPTFSSEDEAEHVTEKKPKDGQKRNSNMLTDDDLKAALLVYGVKAGPIVGSTRAVYERKLRRLQAKRGTSKVPEKFVFCPKECDDDGNDDSDSESTQEDEQFEEQETIEVDVLTEDEHVYQPCFLPSSRLRFVACVSRNADLCCKPTLEKVSKSSQSEDTVQITEETSGASALDQHSALESKVSTSIQDSKCSSENFSITEMVEKMEKRMSPIVDSELNESNDEPWTQSNRLDMIAAEMRQSQWYTPKESLSHWETKGPTKEDLLPDVELASSMTTATCRRPNKGAAERPKQSNYQNPPISPTTLERGEMERTLVPIQIQFVVFVVVALLLFVIVESEPLSPILALMCNFMQGLINDAPVLQSTQTFIGHE